MTKQESYEIQLAVLLAKTMALNTDLLKALSARRDDIFEFYKHSNNAEILTDYRCKSLLKQIDSYIAETKEFLESNTDTLIAINNAVEEKIKLLEANGQSTGAPTE